MAESTTSWINATRAAEAGTRELRFQQLYADTSRPLWAYLYHLAERADVADDLLQEVYCRYLERAPAEMDERALRAYLFRIATNLMQDRWRSPLRREQQEIPDAAAHEALTTQIEVRQMLLELKPRDRQLLWLAYVEGMSHAEIGTATGLNPLSVRICLMRARRRAAEWLKARGEQR